VSDTVLDVSVPCDGCAGPVHFGERACAACGCPISAVTGRAIERRLAAASPELRAINDNVATAKWWLFVLALLHVVFGALFFHLRVTLHTDSASVDLAINLLLAAVMVGGAVIAARWPILTCLLVWLVWVGVQVLTVTSTRAGQFIGFDVIRVVGAKVIPFAALVRATVALRTAADMRVRFSLPRAPHLPPPAQLPSARVVED
jgi:hypothetical protein